MSNKDGAFIATIVSPLADVNDELTDEEVDKLPLQLQYYDGVREKDIIIICRIVETLYQV